MRYLGIILLALYIFSCSQKEETNSTVIIAGQFINSESNEVELYTQDDLEVFPIAEDGHFLIRLDIDDLQTYQLGTDRRSHELFVAPGDSIYVTADSKLFNSSFKVSGDRVAENTYLVNKKKLYNELNMMDLFEKDKESYLEGKERLFAKQRQQFEQVRQAREVHPHFLTLEEAYFEYAPLSFDISYLYNQAHYNNIPKEEVDFPIMELNANLAKVDLGRSDLVNQGNYTAVVNYLISEKTKEKVNQDTTLQNSADGQERATLLAIENLLENPSVRDYFLFSHVMTSLQFKGFEKGQLSINKFQSENQSPNLVKKLEKELKKWDDIMPGMAIPDFTFKDISGETVQLSDLRGTLVYIDIWATWCKPCIGEHPYWDQVKEEYSDKAVSFLTVSIDENKEAWEKMVKAKNMEGLQWIAEKAWRSDLTQYFMVNSIPRFILLDREGRIIDPNTERPSGGIRPKLDQHLDPADTNTL